MRAMPVLLVATAALAASPDPLVGARSHDMMLSPPRGISAYAEGLIAGKQGYVLAQTGTKKDPHGLLLLDRRDETDPDNVVFVVEDVVRLPAPIDAGSVTTECDGRPTIAIVADADRCSGTKAVAQHAWRVVGHRLVAETGVVKCSRTCEDDEALHSE